jgi:hypothetical protein
MSSTYRSTHPIQANSKLILLVSAISFQRFQGTIDFFALTQDRLFDIHNYLRIEPVAECNLLIDLPLSFGF